jgi:NADH:ubiquinone oxidoreductase subunit 4 (subunit M)
LTAALLAASSCAMMGIPPFASFLAELMVISAGITAYLGTAVTVLVSVITGAYLLWMLKRLIIDPAPSSPDVGRARSDISKFDAAVVALYLVPLVLLTVFAFVILSPAAPVAQWAVNLAHGGLHG